MVHVIFSKLNLRASPLTNKIKMLFIFIKKKKKIPGWIKKNNQGIQVPDIGQKVARKVCLRKIRKPYDLVLKAVPNINSLVFH